MGKIVVNGREFPTENAKLILGIDGAGKVVLAAVGSTPEEVFPTLAENTLAVAGVKRVCIVATEYVQIAD